MSNWQKDLVRLILKLNERQKLLTWHIIQVRGETAGELERINCEILEDIEEIKNLLTIG